MKIGIERSRDLRRQAASSCGNRRICIVAPQVVVGVLMCRDELPIGCEGRPGNTAYVTRLREIAKLLR